MRFFFLFLFQAVSCSPKPGSADSDTSPTDAWQLAVTCDDSAESVYAASIASVDATVPLGTVMACHKDALLAAETIAEAAVEQGVVTTTAIQVE